MYKVPTTPVNTDIETEVEIEGETIETKIDRMLNNGEPIQGQGQGGLYTERKQGVLPETNVRTDRFEQAIMATEHTSKTALAKRKEVLEEKNKPQEGETPVQ